MKKVSNRKSRFFELGIKADKKRNSKLKISNANTVVGICINKGDSVRLLHAFFCRILTVTGPSTSTNIVFFNWMSLASAEKSLIWINKRIDQIFYFRNKPVIQRDRASVETQLEMFPSFNLVPI